MFAIQTQSTAIRTVEGLAHGEIADITSDGSCDQDASVWGTVSITPLAMLCVPGGNPVPAPPAMMGGWHDLRDGSDDRAAGC
jgi:hypothetical protein